MIDSHCHLDHEPLYNDINNVIKRAKDTGVENLLTICTTNQSFEKIKKITLLDEMIFGTYGIHPHETEKNIINKEIILKNIERNKRIIGVGETGLDFFYNHSNKKNQVKSFNEHIESSIELNIPIIVHSRNAEKETFEILNDYKNQDLKILMHCYTGSYSFYKKLSKLNSFFSASGIITFKNSTELQKTFSMIPNDKLLIETDSPYLSPVPLRGKKNEPSFIKHTLKKLADLKKIPEIELGDITTKNFKKLFFNEKN